MDKSTGKTVLLVEDEAIIALHQRTELERYGYSVIAARNGEEAISAATESNTVDLVLMDIDLGPGIDGTIAADRILALRNVPLIFVSSHTEREIVARTEGITSYGYVVKNSGITVLDAAIKMAFRLFETHARLLRTSEELQTANEELQVANEELEVSMNTLISREAALRVSEARFRSIVEGAPVPIFIQAGGLFVYVNPPAVALFGALRPDEILFTPVLDRVHPDFHSRVEARMAALAAGRHPDPAILEQQLLTLTGDHIWVETVGEQIEYEGKPGTLVFVRDTSEQHRHREEIAGWNELLRYIIRHSNAAVAVFDTELNFLYVSDRFCDDYRLPDHNIVGRHHYEVFPDLPEKWRQVHQRALAGEISRADKDPYYREDGTIDYTRWECRPWYRSDGTIGGIIVYTEVLTERERIAEQCRLLAENAQDLVYRYEFLPEPRFAYVSPSATRITGYTPEEHYTNPQLGFERVFPEDRHLLTDLQDGDSLEKPLTLRWQHKNGTIVWVEQLNTPIRDPEGQLVALEGRARDITERMTSEQDVRDQDSYLQAVLETTGDGFWTLDAEGTILEVNEAYCRMTGYSRDELVGTTINRIDALESPDETAARIERIRTVGSETFGTKQRRKDGSVFDIEVTASFLGLHGRDLVCFGRDITLENDLERALKKSEAQFRSFIELVPVGVVISDRDQNVLHINGNFSDLFGYTIGDMPNAEAWWPLAYPDPELRNEVRSAWEKTIITAIREGAVAKPLEYPVHCKDGNVRQIEFRLAATGELNAITFSDITERVHAETQIRKLVAEKDLLLREVHHRIKNNMATVTSLLSLHGAKVENETVKGALRDIQSRLLGMQVLYDKLYRAEQIGEASLREYLQSLVTEALALFQTKSVVTTFDIPDILIPAATLSTVGIIVNELVTNAVKHGFAARHRGELEVRGTLDGDLVTLDVSDDGPGLPAPPSNTGIGLTVVDALVRQLDGTISFHRDDRFHATFAFAGPAGSSQKINDTGDSLKSKSL